MGFLHPDDEHREDLERERRELRDDGRELRDFVLVPLRAGRSELEGIGPKTRQVISSERVHGVFVVARRRVDEAIARTLRRAP